MVETFRIYVPTPPYEAAQLAAAFDLIIQQVGLAGDAEEDATQRERALHIIESIAEVRSCCIMAELCENAAGAAGADDQINRCFTRLLSILSYVLQHGVMHALRISVTTLMARAHSAQGSGRGGGIARVALLTCLVVVLHPAVHHPPSGWRSSAWTFSRPYWTSCRQ
ncbi:hypothetical protein EON66_09130 [archaeon]|nr:MAG: hypothetical protein EON66_09130 [archaeon]